MVYLGCELVISFENYTVICGELGVLPTKEQTFVFRVISSNLFVLMSLENKLQPGASIPMGE